MGIGWIIFIVIIIVGVFINNAVLLSKVKVSDGGNATTPSFRIGSDTNGISTPSTNQLNFITNSLTRLAISSGVWLLLVVL